MSQTPAIAWDPAPADTNPAPVVVEVKTESFAEAVEQRAREQIATIKMSTDQTRLNEAVGVRVAELVKELGLPPPKTEEETITELTRGKVESFEMQRIDFMATEKARGIFFDRHPEMKTQEKKQNVQETTQAMSEALMGAFLRFLRDDHQAEQRREHREAQRTKKS